MDTQMSRMWFVVALGLSLCVSPLSLWAKPAPKRAAIPSAGKHPYFSKHPAQWKQVVRLLRATRQLEAIQPRRFSFNTPARDVHKAVYPLSQHKGELILLTRWATWCLSCKYDLVAKRKLAKQIKGVPVAIVGVTHEPFKLVAAYHKTAPKAKIFPYSLVDPGGRLAIFLPGSAYPATSLIDPWGWMISSRVGPGLWITPAYHQLFRFLAKLAPIAWKQEPTQQAVSR